MSYDSAKIVYEFHRLYYERGILADYGQGLHRHTHYHGIEAHKCPLDLWIYQEILWDIKPALIVELGTYLGGTTLFLAHQLDLLGRGTVVSVDVRELPRPAHPRIQYVLGETTGQEALETVRQLADAAEGPVLVIHDADHRRAQVAADLEAYGPLVTPGSYLIVEDTNVNGHPVLVDWGPGPFEAVEEFLAEHHEFARDREREKFLLTYNPGGYLRRQ